RAARQEEIELLAAQRRALAGDDDAVDGGRGGARLEGLADRPQQDLCIAGRRGEREASLVEAAGLEAERERELAAAEAAQREAFGEAGDEAAQHEGERLEPLDRPLEVDALLEHVRLRRGERRLDPLASGAGDELEDRRPH